MAKGAEEPEENEEPDASDINDEIAPLVLKGSDFRHLLQRASASDAHEDEDGTKRKHNKFSHNIALRQVQELWGGAGYDEYAKTVGPEGNPMRHAAAKEHVAALATKKRE